MSTVVFLLNLFVDNSEPDSEADDSSETSESSECSASDDNQNEENQESGNEGMTVEDLLANLKTKSPKVIITILRIEKQQYSREYTRRIIFGTQRKY